MKWLIYKHTNKINGKVYIGQTRQTATERWKNGEGYKHNKFFYNAIKKYGWRNFKHEILEDNISSLDEANKKEIYYIDLYHSYIGDDKCNGYNLTKGGDNRDNLGELIAQVDINTLDIIAVYPSAREAARAVEGDKSGILNCCHKTGRYITFKGFYWALLDEFHSGKWSPQAKKSRKHSEATKEKIRQKALGRKYKPFTKEHKEKIRQAKIGKPRPVEVIEKLRQANIGRKQSAEQIAKKSKKVVCLETNQIFNSAKEAATFLGLKRCAVSSSITKHKTAGGYHWKYVE